MNFILPSVCLIILNLIDFIIAYKLIIKNKEFNIESNPFAFEIMKNYGLIGIILLKIISIIICLLCLYLVWRKNETTAKKALWTCNEIYFVATIYQATLICLYMKHSL